MTREGFDDLLETLLLQAEVLELRADNKVRERRTNVRGSCFPRDICLFFIPSS